jgi:hypothetical protein
MYAILESMLGQICIRGDVNIASYSWLLPAVHGLTLTSADLYVYLHDLLAEAANCGHIHSVQQSDATINSKGSLLMPYQKKRLQYGVPSLVITYDPLNS